MTYKTTIDRVLKQEPTLGYGGFDNSSPQELYNNEEAFNLCCQWILLQPTRKTMNNTDTSYGYKHSVENWQKAGAYISNGIFIAAAIHLGLKYKIYEPNAVFNLPPRRRKIKVSF